MHLEHPDILVETLRERIPSLLAVYLFGSASSGLTHPESDIDVAILAGRPLDPAALWETAQAVAQRLGRDLDLVDLDAASAVMRMQIVGNGTRLFCADRPRCEAFEDFVYSDFARLNEERAGILEDVARRKKVHG